MKLTCPGCGATGSAEVFSADLKAREFAAMMGRVPAEMAGELLLYLSLFRPRQRALAWPRACKLLAEILPAIEAGVIQRNGRDWPADASAWRVAIEVLMGKREQLRLPMKSHGYLLEILCGQADKAEAQMERDREAELRGASTQQRNKVAGAKQEIAGENASRKRLGMAPLTADEEAAIRRSFGVEA